MAASTVRVKGLRELDRDFRKMGGDLSKSLRAGLKEAAEPVRADAARLFAPVSASAAANFRVVARARGVSVEQRRGRTTGQHPEFGRWQLGIALIPALERRADEVIEGIEDVLEHLERKYQL